MQAAAEIMVGEVLNRIKRHPLIAQSHADRISKAQATRWVFCAGRESRTFPDILRGLRLVDRTDRACGA